MHASLPCLVASTQAALSEVDADDRGVLECSLTLPILEQAALLISPPSESGTPPSSSSQKQQQQQPSRTTQKNKKVKSKGFGSAPVPASAPAVQPSDHAQQSTFQGMTLHELNAKRLELLDLVAPGSDTGTELYVRQARCAHSLNAFMTVILALPFLLPS